MQFTPQQLVGAGRYAPATRIGNWNEDLMLEEARMKEFQLRKKQGSLLATHKLKHDFLHQKAPRSAGEDIVRLNYAVGIGHLESDGQLACNVFEESQSIGSGEFIVTVTASSSAMARNTFRLVSPSAWKEAQASGRAINVYSPGDALHYGEPFLIMCNEALLVDDQSVLLKPPLFLKTGLKTERSMSPISYNQRVWLGQEADSAALWLCQRADLGASDKFLACGGEVRSGDKIALVHKMTGQPLCAESKIKQPTDFGVELEVCALATKTSGKHHNLAAEALGVRTADTEGRIHLAPNTWTFVLSTNLDSATDARMIPDLATPSSIISVLRQCLVTESLYAFRRFIVGLMKLDSRGTGQIQREEAKWSLKHHHLPLREEHLDVLFDAFDRRNTGHFPLSDLLRLLRPSVSEQRRFRIQATFEKLVRDIGETGKLPVNRLVQCYNPSVDSRVRTNQMAADDARAEFRELFTTSASMITLCDFAEMYSDVSAGLDNDDHFSQLLAESWQ